MLLSVLKDAFRLARAKPSPATSPKAIEPIRAISPGPRLAPVWRVYGDQTALQRAFYVAVIMTTVGRPSLRKAVQSVYDQAFNGRIQLLVGVDAPLGSFDEHENLFAGSPPNVTVCFYYPGYSTSVRHGGLHPARDGGVLRAVLTYMANARHVAYLDDDNWWNPVHLQSLLMAASGKDWAFADRWFLHEKTGQVVCADDWESVGPGRGYFADFNGGWVDPNCLLFEKFACEPAIRWWTIPLPGDAKAMSADRHVYAFLQQKSTPGKSGLTTTYYALQPDDGLHPFRLQMMEASTHDETAEHAGVDTDTEIDFSFLLPTRNRVKGLSELLASVEAMTARPERLEIVLGIDEDDQASRDFEWNGLNVVKVVVPPGLTMGRLNQACYRASRGRYLMAMNDDVLLRTPSWDEKVRLALDAVRDDVFLVHVNDKLFGPALCCFPLVSRTFCEMAGGFCPEEYERYRIDDHIHEVFSLLASRGHHRILYFPNVIFEHLNFVAGQDGQRLYPLHGEILERDAARFTDSSPTRHELAEELSGYIESARDRRIALMERRMGRP
jgi:hypothetical protein